MPWPPNWASTSRPRPPPWRAFAGIHRRSEIKGEVAGILVMDDYGHHPTEIETTLQAITEGWGRPLTVVFPAAPVQPHPGSLRRLRFGVRPRPPADPHRHLRRRRGAVAGNERRGALPRHPAPRSHGRGVRRRQGRRGRRGCCRGWRTATWSSLWGPGISTRWGRRCLSPCGNRGNDGGPVDRGAERRRRGLGDDGRAAGPLHVVQGRRPGGLLRGGAHGPRLWRPV